MSIHNWKFSPINNKFFWEALNEAGQILGRSSQDFKSKSGAFYNADLLGRSGKFSQQLNWEIFPHETGFKWKADNRVNKENVGMSHKVFESRADAESNASLFGYTWPENVSPKANFANTAATNSTVIPGSKGIVNDSNKETISTTKVNSVDSNKNDAYATYFDNDNNSKDSGFFADWWMWLLGLILLLALFLFLFLPWLQNQNKNASPVVTNSSSNSSVVATDYTQSLKDSQFSTLSGLIKNSDLGDSLNKFGQPITLLAPTNSAFSKLPADTLANLSKPENKSQLQETLRLHVIPGNVDLVSLKSGSSLKTLAGATLPVEVIDGKYKVGDVGNIDSTVDGTSGNIKVYGIENVLKTTVNPTSVSSIAVSSAVSSSPASSSQSSSAPKVEIQTLNVPFIAALEKQGNFTLFVNALKAADLKNSLEASAPITVFAPNDDALKSVQATYDNLLKPENKQQLQNFVRNHIVNGTNSFEDFKINKKLTAQNGRTINIKTNDQGIGQVIGEKNTAQAPVPDIQAPNAIVHVLTDTPLRLE